MSPEEIQTLFTHGDGTFRFARWGKPIVPVVFGVSDATLAVVKGAIEAVTMLAGHKMATLDPDLGANLFMFFVRDWSEMSELPDIAHLVPDSAALFTRLESAGADHYRLFRFDPDGAIRAAVIFVRIGTRLSDSFAEELALNEAVKAILLWPGQGNWSALVFESSSGRAGLRPDFGSLIRAAYDPALPSASTDASLAYRLFARAFAANSVQFQ